MFYGQKQASVDCKWRLVFPKDIGMRLKKNVLLKEGKQGLEIHQSQSSISEKDAPFVSFSAVKKTNQGQKRVVIPFALRNSESFFFGRKVVLAGRGKYLEIWPLP